MKKSKSLLVIILMFLLGFIMIGCGGDDVPTVDDPTTDIPTVDENTPSEEENTPTQEVVTVIKSEENLVLEVGEEKEYSLSEYFQYSGNTLSLSVSDEDKNVVSYELFNGKLTITALKGGSEKVVVSLGDKNITFNVTVNEVKVPVFNDIDVTYSIDENETYEVELAPTEANGYTEFSYLLKEDYTGVSILEDKLIVSFDDPTTLTVGIVVSYGDELTVEFDVNIKATTAIVYQVVNGSFDDGLNGWTLSGQIGEVSNASTFWNEGLPMFNEGNYFSAYGLNGENFESNTGKLTSSTFTLLGNGYITFMLGGAGNENCYVAVEDINGNVLAIYRNTEFTNTDLPAEEARELIGSTINLANFIKYKADLSEYIGQELKVVVYDNAISDWGLVFFDELNTYHLEELTGYVEAVNQLADFTTLKNLVDEAILEQGDYTTASFEEYSNALTNGKNALTNISLKQNVVDEISLAIISAKEKLTLREIIVKVAEDSKKVIIGETLTLSYSYYFDDNNLSNVTYNASCEEEIVLGDGKVSLDTTTLNVSTITITLNALYKGEVKESVVVTVGITNDVTPVVKESRVTRNIDFYELDSTSYEFDLASNIENIGNVELTYSVYVNDEWKELTSSNYVHQELGSFEINVKVSYQVEGETLDVSYVLVLNISNTSNYRLTNGGFETGDLSGWTLVGQLGAVSSDTHYWVWEDGGYAFGKEENYMFSSYALDNESAYGYLMSSKFTVGGSGWITFKIGAMKNTELLNVQIIDANTGEILKAFGNSEWKDLTEEVKSGCTLNAYKADLSSLLGKEVYIRVVDYAYNDYGCLFLDSFNTYYAEEPSDDYYLASNLEISGNAYQVYNGGFETGNLSGWYLVNNLGNVSSAETYWNEGIPFNKDGMYLFSNYEGGMEAASGTLISSPFRVGGAGWITFKFGGARHTDLINLQIIDAKTHQILKSFGNQLWTDADLKGCQLIAYKADLSSLLGKDVYIRVVDNAYNDYGCFFLDSVITYYESQPSVDFNVATDLGIAGNAFTVYNGGFETGDIKGWSVVGEVGAVSDADTYWVEEVSFNKEGSYLFSHYAAGTEAAKGTLSSGAFVVGGSGFITYRIGAFGNENMYIEIVDAASGLVLETLKNTLWNDADLKGCQLIPYKVDLSEYSGRTVYVRFVDNAESGYGCMFVDDLVTYYETEPNEGFNLA